MNTKILMMISALLTAFCGIMFDDFQRFVKTQKLPQQIDVIFRTFHLHRRSDNKKSSAKSGLKSSTDALPDGISFKSLTNSAYFPSFS